MSQFDFPRIHFNGLIDVNVGTANNDDYSSYTFNQSSFNPPKPEFNGQPLRLADSLAVQAKTYGMTDEEWLEWVQKIQSFDDADGKKAQLIPAEWNFYGGMGLTMKGVKVNSVQNAPEEFDLNSPLLDADLSFNMRPGGNMASTGVICDVNPESVPSSQFIASNMLLEKNNQALMSGVPSKGSTRYINFQRNVALTASAGASAVVYHTLSKEELQGQQILEIFGEEITGKNNFKGVLIRYSLYRSMPPINGFNYSDEVLQEIVDLYKNGGLNSAELQITGSIAPWYEGEFSSITMCRNMMPQGTFPSPGGNGSKFSLAPVLLKYNNSIEQPYMSLDLINSFPEQYNKTEKINPKFDLGEVMVTLSRKEGDKYIPCKEYGPIDYQTSNYLKRGGLIDIYLSEFKEINEEDPSNDPDELTDSELYVELSLKNSGEVLSREADYMIASDTSTVYAEQDLQGNTQEQFNFNGEDVSISFSAYYRGSKVSNIAGGLTIQVFETTPNQDAHGPTNSFSYQLETPLSISNPEPGNKLFYCALPGETITDFSGINLMTFPIICMRVLPNEDYDQYYVDPKANQPVANEQLTFEILYEKVLRNYYLLYPAMSKHVPLNNKEYWNGPDMARRMYSRLQTKMWPTVEYMPRTRDLSESRRTLLQAWCLKVLQG